MECIFCEIIKGNISSYSIYEDDIVIAFLDINPDCNGHTLIIPKKHIVDINDMDEETFTHIFKITKLLASRIKEKLNCDGLTLIQNNGDVQEVKHFHLHLKPFYHHDDKIKIEDIYNLLNI